MKDKTRPMRDSNGRFVKGHKPLIRPKYLCAKYYPKLYCNTCYMGSICPEYHAGYVCAHIKKLKKFKTRNADEVFEALADLTDYSIFRVQQMAVSENLSGELDPNLTKQIGVAMKQAMLMYQLHMQRERGKQIGSPVSKETLDGLINHFREQQAMEYDENSLSPA